VTFSCGFTLEPPFSCRARYWSHTNLRRDQHIGVARKQFFFEKKNQKTFAQLDDAPDTNGMYLREQKFFGSFFQKRTASFALAFLGQRVALNAGWYQS
jgi:hypothetical protein